MSCFAIQMASSRSTLWPAWWRYDASLLLYRCLIAPLSALSLSLIDTGGHSCAPRHRFVVCPSSSYISREIVLLYLSWLCYRSELCSNWETSLPLTTFYRYNTCLSKIQYIFPICLNFLAFSIVFYYYCLACKNLNNISVTSQEIKVKWYFWKR